jgi:hypothetical protein
MSTQFKAGTWASKIFLLGKETFEKSSNKEIAAMVNCDNQGIVSRERKAVADKTGWAMQVGRAPAAPVAPAAPADDWSGFGSKIAQPAKQPVSKPRKQAGSLPEKVEGFLVGLVDDVPDVWEPSHIYQIIEADEVSWNRFIRRMADLDNGMIESLERWLGRGATMSRQAAFDEIIETSAQWDRKANAEALARELIALGFGEKTPAAILRETWL